MGPSAFLKNYIGDPDERHGVMEIFSRKRRRVRCILVGIVVLLSLCDSTSIQEAVSGCEIEAGTLPCLNLETKCKTGFGRWEEAEVENGVKCQCCEDRDE